MRSVASCPPGSGWWGTTSRSSPAARPEELSLGLRLAASGQPFPIDLLDPTGGWNRRHGRVGAFTRDGARYWVLSLDDTSVAAARLTALNNKIREADERARAQRQQQLQLEAINDDLREAEQRLAEVNGDLEHFAHIAAHDLKGPCRRQMMLAELMAHEAGDELDETVRRRLDLIVDQSRIMAGMIEGFRAITNLAGPAVERTPIELRSLVESLVEAAVPVDLRDQVTVDLPEEIEGYEPLVRLLYQNLIVNAVRHGERPLDLVLDHDPPGSVFRAVNTTAGCPSDPIDLLQPFVRGEGTGPGSGLGLSICRRVVQRHQGRIWIDCEDGRFQVAFTLGKEFR